MAEALFERWRAWYDGLDPRQVQQQFENWKKLDERRQVLQEIMQRHSAYHVLDLRAAQDQLNSAAEKLRFEVPYRIVVLGESGAGKSSFANALLGRDLLPMAAGGAVTGAATYVSVLADSDEEVVKVFYRTDEQFVDLIARIAARYKFRAPESPESILADLANQAIQEQLQPREDIADQERVLIVDDLADIARTWINMREKGLVGHVNDTLHPVRDQKRLHDLLDEISPLNKIDPSKESPDRVVPGIERVEYLLSASAGAMSGARGMRNVAFVDTPGSGARTLRHNEILLREVKQADAVILVVNANRPGDRTASMAHLLQNVLFKGYDPEQKTRFAGKVFLVVNQYDFILKDPKVPKVNKLRLDTSIQEVTRLIAPDYWKRYCAPVSPDRRYFESIAQLAILARKKQQAGLTDDEQTLYETYLPLFDSDASSPETIEGESGILRARSRVQQFLSDQRLKLMIEEAEAQLNGAEREMKQAAESVLRANNVERGFAMSAAEVRLRHRQKLSNDALVHAREALQGANDRMIAAMDEWRRSKQHETHLIAAVRFVYRSLIESIQSALDRLMDRNAILVGSYRDDTTGQYYTEGRVRALALEVELRLRETLEIKSSVLGDYYYGHFESILNMHRLSALLIEKSYGQDYVAPLAPVKRMDDGRDRLCSNFANVCRWLLLYELIKRPILIQEQVPENVTCIWEVLKDVAPELAAIGVEVLMVYAGMSHPVAQVARVIAGEAFASGQSGNPTPQQRTTTSDPSEGMKGLFGGNKPDNPPSRSRQPQAVPSGSPAAGPSPAAPAVGSTQASLPTNTVMIPDLQLPASQYAEEQLVKELQRLLLERNFDDAKRILQEQLALRYHSAFGAALPLIERLFFYELGKFRRAYDDISDMLINEHRHYVAVQKDLAIQDILLGEMSAKLEDMDQAISLLAEVDGLRSMPV